MIKKAVILIVAVLILGLVYLLFWPVPIEPKAWNAPINKGYTGIFAPNMRLAGLKTLSIGNHHGPEDVVSRMENGEIFIYVTTQTGEIIRINPGNNTHSVYAKTGGVALGIDIDNDENLIIADAYKGLLLVDKNAKVHLLTNKAEDGSPILYADELAIAKDGRIYFSDASTKFGAKAAGSSMKASLLEIMEHGKTGRILVYNPQDKTTKILLDGLSFPNGVGMCPDDECILFAETGTYEIKRYWLKGAKAGITEVIIGNLPGFPDNLNGYNGRYWIGLTSPRAPALDKFSDKPFVRKIFQRLPASMRPKARNYGFVFAIDMDGNILAQYQDPSGAYPLTTGAYEAPDGWLYISSLSAKNLGRMNIKHEFDD